MSKDDIQQSALIDPLYQKMRCGIVSDQSGKIIIVYDNEIVSEIQWIEYEPEQNKLWLVYEDGQLQDLGIQPNEKMKANLANGVEVTLAHIENKKLVSTQNVVIIIKNY